MFASKEDFFKHIADHPDIQQEMMDGLGRRLIMKRFDVKERWAREAVRKFKSAVLPSDKTEVTNPDLNTLIVRVETHGPNATKDIDALLERHGIDRKIWDIERCKVKYWTTPMRDSDMNPIFMENEYLEVTVKRRELLPVTFAPIQPVVIKGKEHRVLTPSLRLIDGSKTIFVCGDWQVGFYRQPDGGLEPFHDRKALELCVALVELHNPDTIVLGGDLWDMTEFTEKFLVTPECTGVTTECIKEVGYWIWRMRQAAPRAEIFYIEGNHEERLINTVIRGNTAAAYNIPRFGHIDKHPILSVPFLLSLEEMNVTYLEKHKFAEVYVGDIRFIHGNGGGGANFISKYADQATETTVVFHHHRQALRSKTLWNRNGEWPIQIFCPGGCFRINGLLPRYQKRQDAQQGAGVIYVTKYGHQIKPYLFRDGTTIHDGKVVTVDVKEIREVRLGS